MSLNELASYMTAGPVSRESIVRNQKYPKDFMVIWYEDATRAIVDFLCGTPDAIDNKITELVFGPQKASTANNIEALQIFQARYDTLGFDQYSFCAAGNDSPKLTIEGVEVSIRPELTLERPSRKGQTDRGFLKLHFSKVSPLDPIDAQYTTAIMKKWTQENHPGLQCPNNLLLTLDVFSAQVYAAPKAYINRLRNIETACREIAVRWPTL